MTATAAAVVLALALLCVVASVASRPRTPNPEPMPLAQSREDRVRVSKQKPVPELVTGDKIVARSMGDYETGDEPWMCPGCGERRGRPAHGYIETCRSCGTRWLCHGNQLTVIPAGSKRGVYELQRAVNHHDPDCWQRLRDEVQT
jgi:hypothetical protein